MDNIERWWYVHFPAGIVEATSDEDLLLAARSCGYPVTGPYVLEAEQPQGAVSERDVLARALTMACGSAEVRESCVRQARAALDRERGQ
jgi:hypothetical protein